MLPIRIDLHRADRQHERAFALPGASIEEAVFDNRLATARERGRPGLYVAQRPHDRGNGQGAVNERMADSFARRRAMQLTPEANKRRYLWAAALRFKIGVFVEEPLLSCIELAERGPIDLPAKKGLRVQLPATRPCGPFEGANRHPVLVEDAQLELLDDRAHSRARFTHCQTEITRRGRAPPEAVGPAVAGCDATDLTEVLAIVGEMHGEDSPVGLTPRDECAEGGADIAEINGDVFPSLGRGRARRGGPAREPWPHRQIRTN